MSLLPLMFRDMMAMSRPLRMLENHMRITEELFQPIIIPMIRIQRREQEFREEPENIIQDKEKFQIKLDVQNFTPNEITVKTMDGNAIQVEAKHEKEEEKGFISRHLIRKFILPKGHDLKDVVTSLSSDGILTVTAPKKLEKSEEETVLNINYTGPEREKDIKKSEDSSSTST